MKKSCLALAALLGFSAYTIFTMLTAHQSLAAFGLELMASPDTAQVVINLVAPAYAGLAFVHYLLERLRQDRRLRGVTLLDAEAPNLARAGS